jgi:hypothetical protein
MMQENLIKTIFPYIALLLLSGCGVDNVGPDTVADAYWQAITSGDQTMVETLVIEQADPVQLSVFSGGLQVEGKKVREIRLESAIIEDGKARVPTVIIAKPDLNLRDFDEIKFDTQLVKVDGQWKVDKLTTEKNMMTAVLGAAMNSLGAAFSEGMQGAVESIGQAVAEGMQVMVEGIAEGLEQAKKGSEDIDSSLPQIDYKPLSARVSGEIEGTTVALKKAEWSNALSLYEGDNWGSNPSVLVFLFLAEGESPVAKTFSIAASDNNFHKPHVHYRWRNPESGEINTEIATGNYNLDLKFGRLEERRVTGEINFSVPDRNTKIAGTFEIELSE